MAKADANKSIGLAILGIVAIMAVVGLVLLFSGSSATGKAGVEQSYAANLGGRNVNKYFCPESCLVSGMRGSMECIVKPQLAGKPTYVTADACAGELKSEAILHDSCSCPPSRDTV